jgi:hypothetical protein
LVWGQQGSGQGRLGQGLVGLQGGERVSRSGSNRRRVQACNQCCSTTQVDRRQAGTAIGIRKDECVKCVACWRPALWLSVRTFCPLRCLPGVLLLLRAPTPAAGEVVRRVLPRVASGTAARWYWYWSPRHLAHSWIPLCSDANSDSRAHVGRCSCS